MDGIEFWYTNQLKDKVSEYPASRKQQQLNRVKETFKELKECVGIDSRYANKPLTKRIDSNSN